jgi:quinol monooxygenase YgiN
VLLETALARAIGDHGFWRSLMYGTLMKIVVKPGKRSKLLDYLRWDAQVAKASEPGTWRFDVWMVKKKKRDVVYIYEAYKDETAFKDHKKHGPYKEWKKMKKKTMKKVTKVIPLTESVASNACPVSFVATSTAVLIIAE